jgi:FAD/FMN-containing dehydrogenase
MTIKAASDGAYRRLIERFAGFYAEALMNPHWGESVHLRPDNRLEVSMVCADLDGGEAYATWKPFLAWLAAAPADYTFTDKPSIGVLEARAWWDAPTRLKSGSTSMVPDRRSGAPPTHAWWSGDQAQAGAFLYAYDSLWLDAALLSPARRGALADALFAASRFNEVELHINKGLAGAPDKALAAARDTAMNPQVANAFALAIIATGGPAQYPGLPFPSPAASMEHAKAEAIKRGAAALRAVAPKAGSYLSESNFFNARWAADYWGEANHARLARVKAKYDPDGLFFVHHGVGSEAWSADGFTWIR